MKKIDQSEDWSSLDELIENQVRQISHSAPSTDFTTKVMDRIAMEKKAVTTYQPLISKKGWFVLFALVGALVIFSFNSRPTENTVWFSTLNNYLSTITLPEIPFFQSKTIVNSIAIGCLMLLFQFFIISKKIQLKD